MRAHYWGENSKSNIQEAGSVWTGAYLLFKMHFGGPGAGTQWAGGAGGCAYHQCSSGIRGKGEGCRDQTYRQERTPRHSNKSFISPESMSHCSFARRCLRSDHRSLLNLCMWCRTASPVLACGCNAPNVKTGTDPVGPQIQTQVKR
jgi:hypothetical protein